MHLLGFVIVILALATPLLAIQCPQANLEQAKKSEHALAEFAIHFYKNVSGKLEDKNAVMSPASVALALAMLENGADGATREEIKNYLVGTGSNTDALATYRSLQQHLKIDDANTKLSMANGLFLQKNFNVKQSYSSSIKDCFDGAMETKDFADQLEQTRQDINKWISDKTVQKIPELFKPQVLTADVVLVVANAIYFKSQWKFSFNQAQTRSDTFYKSGREQQQVPFMKRKGMTNFHGDESIQVIELPYKNEDVSMFVMLPNARDGLRNFEASLTAEKFKSITSNLSPINLVLDMPKFTIRTPVELKSTLMEMGLSHMFSRGANFNRITDMPIQISKAVHEAYINVHENGTEAAAATGFAATPRNMPRTIKADHPFMYAIVHKPTGAIVFIGKVNYIENQN